MKKKILAGVATAAIIISSLAAAGQMFTVQGKGSMYGSKWESRGTGDYVQIDDESIGTHDVQITSKAPTAKHPNLTGALIVNCNPNLQTFHLMPGNSVFCTLRPNSRILITSDVSSAD